MEKTADIKDLDDAILGLKRQISKLKDELAEYATFETFLYSLSPDAWRQMQVRVNYVQQTRVSDRHINNVFMCLMENSAIVATTTKIIVT